MIIFSEYGADALYVRIPKLWEHTFTEVSSGTRKKLLKIANSKKNYKNPLVRLEIAGVFVRLASHAYAVDRGKCCSLIVVPGCHTSWAWCATNVHLRCRVSCGGVIVKLYNKTLLPNSENNHESQAIHCRCSFSGLERDFKKC